MRSDPETEGRSLISSVREEGELLGSMGALAWVASITEDPQVKKACDYAWSALIERLIEHFKERNLLNERWKNSEET